MPGLIIDFSSREQNEQELCNEIEKSNVICLVYSMDDEESKKRLASYWLPKIAEIEKLSTQQVMSSSASFTSNLADPGDSTNSSNLTSSKFSLSLNIKNEHLKRPIVLVANKSDILINFNVINQDQFISELIDAHPQIETCIHCSAKSLKNVPEVFYYAQKTVLYPTWPVCNPETKELTLNAVRCFKRIFQICDTNNDGVLSDDELNDFQLKCFKVKLNSSALQELKLLLNERGENLLNNQITFDGFLQLQTLFFRKGRNETAWTVLKKFGYDKNLTISREYLSVRYNYFKTVLLFKYFLKCFI